MGKYLHEDKLIVVIAGLLPIGPVLMTGQQSVKCRHEDGERAPSYRIGWRTYSAKGPKTLFLAVGIDARHFSRDDIALVELSLFWAKRAALSSRMWCT